MLQKCAVFKHSLTYLQRDSNFSRDFLVLLSNLIQLKNRIWGKVIAKTDLYSTGFPFLSVVLIGHRLCSQFSHSPYQYQNRVVQCPSMYTLEDYVCLLHCSQYTVDRVKEEWILRDALCMWKESRYICIEISNCQHQVYTIKVFIQISCAVL